MPPDISPKPTNAPRHNSTTRPIHPSNSTNLSFFQPYTCFRNAFRTVLINEPTTHLLSGWGPGSGLSMLNYDGFKSAEKGMYTPPALSYGQSFALCDCMIKLMDKIRVPTLGAGDCIVASSDFVTSKLSDTSPADHNVLSLNLPNVPSAQWHHIKNSLRKLVPSTRHQVVAFARERERNNPSFVCVPRGSRNGDVGYINFDDWAEHMKGESSQSTKELK